MWVSLIFTAVFIDIRHVHILIRRISVSKPSYYVLCLTVSFCLVILKQETCNVSAAMSTKIIVEMRERLLCK